MALQATPVFIRAGSHPSEDVRRYMYSMVGQRGGIVNSGDLAVTQNGTPNMSVNVATGDVFVPGTEATYQGVYHCENRGTLNLTVAASDPVNGRRDLVVARIRDAAYATGPSSTFALEVLTGTPSGSPVDPTVPANCWVLARLTVGAAVTSIVTGNITDLRTAYANQGGRAAALGGTIVCVSTARPTVGLNAGTVMFETDTKNVYIYNGTSWDLFSSVPTAWTAPTLLNSWQNFGSGFQAAQYRKVGDEVQLRGLIRLGTINTVAFTLPTGFRPPATLMYVSQDNNQAGRVDIATTGDVTPVAIDNTWQSLNGITFSVSS